MAGVSTIRIAAWKSIRGSSSATGPPAGWSHRSGTSTTRSTEAFQPVRVVSRAAFGSGWGSSPCFISKMSNVTASSFRSPIA